MLLGDDLQSPFLELPFDLLLTKIDINLVQTMAFLPTPALPCRTMPTNTRPFVQSLTMKRKPPSPKQNPEPKEPGTDSKSTPARLPEDMLLEDLKKIRAKRKLEPEATKEPVSPFATVKSAIETILLWDFFLVLGLLAWLAVALIPHFAGKNDVLLDPWLALWQPFIQPVLGVLMLGTIVQGTVSFITKD